MLNEYGPALVLLTSAFLFFMIVIFVSPNDVEAHKNRFTENCTNKWSSFEARVVETSKYTWVCQVFNKGQWLPAENIVFDLDK